MAEQIGLIRVHQIDEAARALARAFFDDPLQTYFLPDAEERRALSVPMFKAF